jgi:hypothetical protein
VYVSCASLALTLIGAESLTDTNLFVTKYTNVTSLVESPDDPAIVNLVGQILQRSHYERQLLNDEVSSKFLDQYLNALDPQRLYFLQSDLEEFEHYRYRLDNLILESGDAHPSRLIFNRFRTRLDQQYEYAMGLLQAETFTFDDDDRYLKNRKDEPRSKDMESARRLWRERLRYEYLQEKLGIGRPEEIAEMVLERLTENKADTLPAALKDKLGKERLETILALVRESAEKQSPSEVASRVRDRLEADNAREIVKLISKRYNRILRSLNEYDNGDVLQLYLTSLAHVYDPHSDYMGKLCLRRKSCGPRAFFHQRAGRVDLDGRHRKRFGTKCIVRARRAGDADLPIDFRVIRFQFRVTDRPVSEIRAFDSTPQASLTEVAFAKAPEIGGEVHAAAAHGLRVLCRRAKRLCRYLALIVTKRLATDGRTTTQQFVIQHDGNFIVSEILCLAIRPLFKDHNIESPGGQFPGHDATGGTRADNHEIDLFAGRKGNLRHRCSPSCTRRRNSRKEK